MIFHQLRNKIFFSGNFLPTCSLFRFPSLGFTAKKYKFELPERRSKVAQVIPALVKHFMARYHSWKFFHSCINFQGGFMRENK